MADSNIRWDRRLAVILILAAAFLLLLAAYRSLRGNIGKIVGDFCYPYWNLSRYTADSVSDSSLLAYDRAELIAKLEQLQRENNFTSMVYISHHPQKQISTIRPFDLPSRLWSYLVEKALGERAQNRWQNLNQKELNRLVNTLCNDSYQIAGRAAFKDEFVTCGGIDLAAVDPNTLESKDLPRVYFAGEVLDIDGITGGFNFQAAWTTAFTVAQAIAINQSDRCNQTPSQE